MRAGSDTAGEAAAQLLREAAPLQPDRPIAPDSHEKEHGMTTGKQERVGGAPTTQQLREQHRQLQVRRHRHMLTAATRASKFGPRQLTACHHLWEMARKPAI